MLFLQDFVKIVNIVVYRVSDKKNGTIFKLGTYLPSTGSRHWGSGVTYYSDLVNFVSYEYLTSIFLYKSSFSIWFCFDKHINDTSNY